MFGLLIGAFVTVWLAATFVFVYPSVAWWTASPTPNLHQSEVITEKGNVRYVTAREKRIVDGCRAVLRFGSGPISSVVTVVIFLWGIAYMNGMKAKAIRQKNSKEPR